MKTVTAPRAPTASCGY